MSVDHRAVGNGWVYLGTYHLAAGRSAASGSVVITNASSAGGSVVIADAIRFGNGMGDVPHGPAGIGTGSPSGYPREDENALLWTWRSVGQGRDFTSPSAVVGTDNVSAPIRMAEDMNADTNAYGTSVYVGFHSNATTGNLTTATARGAIGLVHSTSPTPNQAGLATRLARQINVDMRSRDGQFESPWSTRTTYTLTGSYGEISNARAGSEFDATIIEVGFHDQAIDNALLRDPRVRDQLARSVYEGTLEHFTDFPGTTSAPANVTLPSPPLQVAAVAAADGSVTVSWVPGPSSSGGVDGVFGSPATAYRIEASINGLGFDGGTLVTGGASRSARLGGLDPSTPYQFRVVAENGGGRSLPSDVVSVLPQAGRRQVLVVNGFDRLDKGQNFRQAYAYGGSTTDRVWARFNNSRDYPAAVHNAIHASRPGVRVDSASNEAVVAGTVRLADYEAVIWVLGTESAVDRTFDAVEQALVEAFLAGGGDLFVTGSDLAYDLDAQNGGRAFLRESLGVSYASGDANTFQVAAAAGGIFAGIPGFTFANGSAYSSLDSQTYGVTAPDAFTVAPGTAPALVYAGGDGGVAGVHRQGNGGRGSVVAFGFPYEIITQPTARIAIMDRVLEAFAIEAPPMDVVISVATGDTVIDSEARSGNVRLVKRGSGRLVIERANTFTGGTLIEGGEIVLRHPTGLGPGGITLRGQGRLSLDIGVERLQLPLLDMATTARIDVGLGGLQIASGGVAEEHVVALLTAGRGDGDWAASSAGIGSAFAGAGSGRGVGFVRDEADATSIAFAAAGDVNLDSVVDILDVSALLAGGSYDAAATGRWAAGDFTYDGLVDILDIAELFAAVVFDAGSYVPSGSLSRRRIR